MFLQRTKEQRIHKFAEEPYILSIWQRWKHGNGGVLLQGGLPYIPKGIFGSKRKMWDKLQSQESHPLHNQQAESWLESVMCGSRNLLLSYSEPNEMCFSHQQLLRVYKSLLNRIIVPQCSLVGTYFLCLWACMEFHLYLCIIYVFPSGLTSETQKSG